MDGWIKDVTVFTLIVRIRPLARERWGRFTLVEGHSITPLGVRVRHPGIGSVRCSVWCWCEATACACVPRDGVQKSDNESVDLIVRQQIL